MPNRQFFPRSDSSFGYHWEVPAYEQQLLVRYTPTRHYNQLYQCLPLSFQKVSYTLLPNTLVVKIQRNGLSWSIDFGLNSYHNATGALHRTRHHGFGRHADIDSADYHSQTVIAAIRALQAIRQLTKREPHSSVDRIVVITDSENLVKKAAWGESLDAAVNRRRVRKLYRELEHEIRGLEREARKVRFWLHGV